MKLFFENTGCSIESIDFLRLLNLTNGTKTNNVYEADIVIAHFCAISTEAIKNIPHIMGIFDEVKRRNPNVKFYVGGCAEGVIDFKKKRNVDGTFRRRHMVEDLAMYLNYKYEDGKEAPIHFHGGIKIQSGCARKCSFCKQAYLDMTPKSIPIDKILLNVKKAVEDGFGEIALLAENSTEYGMDLKPRVKLIDLLKKLCSVEGLKYISLTALCIDELSLDPELVDYICKNPMIRKVQVESQSYIDAVRKEMNLKSSAEEALRIVKEFKSHGKFIVSNVMVGHPGENSTDFQKQLKLIEEEELTFVDPNKYDNTPMVHSSTLRQVPEDVANRRLLNLVKTIIRVRETVANRMVGSIVECVYSLDNIFEILGTSETVNIDTHRKYKPGQVIRVKLTSYEKAEETMVLRFKGVKMADGRV